VLDLLGAVARLRTPVDLNWLATWVEPHPLTAFTERTATFFHRNGTEWQFIHNSFRRFLSDETARGRRQRRFRARPTPAHESRRCLRRVGGAVAALPR
jgi:hypothetical protein